MKPYSAYYDNIMENPSFGFILCAILPTELMYLVWSTYDPVWCPWCPKTHFGCWLSTVLGILCGLGETKLLI